MFGSDPVMALFSLHDGSIHKVWLLHLEILSLCPRRQRLNAPMYLVVLPIASDFWVFVVVTVEVQDLVPPMLPGGVVLVRSRTHNLVRVLHGRDSLELQQLLFLGVLLKMVLADINLGAVDGTPQSGGKSSRH